MAIARMKFLSDDEEELIHDKSLEALSDIGVLIRSDSVLSLLEDTGVVVDKKNRIARIPENIVNEALKNAPREFTLCAREHENDINVPTSGRPWITTDGLTLYMIDMETGERRNATRKDFADFARLSDAIDAIDYYWPIVTIADVPQMCHNSYELWTAFQNCTLHVQGDCTSAKDASIQIELASKISGGKKELKRRPIFSSATNPISPLSFDKGAVEAQVIFAKAGIPILCHSMSLSGMSAPITIAGTIANVNIENLASLVISQCAAPGAPHIYGCSSAPIDMMTGSVNFLAPEHLFISAAAGQMAHRYGRPCMTADWGMGRNGPGMKISFSEAFSYSASVLSGSDLISGIGGLDYAKGCSLEQIVIDSSIWENFRATFRNFTIDEETIALDIMKDVGQGNSYVTHPHTAKNFRRELHFWDRKKLSLESTLSSSMLAEARKTVKTLLNSHEVSPLDKDISMAGEKILRDYEKLVAK